MLLCSAGFIPLVSSSLQRQELNRSLYSDTASSCFSGTLRNICARSLDK
jgi:hypothetical protein